MTENEKPNEWAKMDQAIAQAKGDDPAPDPVSIAHSNMSNMLNSITNKTLDELRKMRDSIDDQMRILQTRNDVILSAFTEHVGFSVDVIKNKQIIEESLSEMNKRISNGQNPLPKTITVGNSNG